MARATATWSQPTEREPGGVPFDAATELLNSEIRVSADDGATWSAAAIVPPTETQFVVDNIAIGAYQFELVHVDTDNRRSAPLIASTSVLGAPLAAGDFAVSIEP